MPTIKNGFSMTCCFLRTEQLIEWNSVAPVFWAMLNRTSRPRARDSGMSGAALGDA